MTPNPTNVFMIFMVFVLVIVCSDDVNNAILYLTVMTNFIIMANIFTGWDRKHKKEKEHGTMVDAHGSDSSPSAETTPLNPPPDKFSPGENPVPEMSAGYNTLENAEPPNYGPRYREYDSLRQTHLDMFPAAKYPKDIFATNDANSRLSMDNLSRGRKIQRSIDDAITRDDRWYGYLYDDELKYQGSKHWMSNYEY